MCLFLLESKWPMTRCFLKTVHNQPSAGHTQVTSKVAEVIPLATPKAPSLGRRVSKKKKKAEELCVFHSSPSGSALFSPSPKHKLLLGQCSYFTTASSICKHIYKGFSAWYVVGIWEKREVRHIKRRNRGTYTKWQHCTKWNINWILRHAQLIQKLFIQWSQKNFMLRNVLYFPTFRKS